MSKLTKPEAMAILEALWDGKQGQMRLVICEGEKRWQDKPSCLCAEALFAGIEVRIKPEPRKYWLKMHGNGEPYCRSYQCNDECAKRCLENYTKNGWTLCTEPEGKE